LGKLFWPHPLLTVYPRWEIPAAAWYSYLPLAAVFVLFGILWLLWLRRAAGSRAPFFTFGYFLAALFPTLGLVNITYFHYSFVADHFQYLASMGPLALAGGGLDRFSALLPRSRWLSPAIGGGLLLVLGALTWRQACFYENEETLWTHTLFWNPACAVGYNDLASALFQAGEVDQSIAACEQALELDPNYDQAHFNLGNGLLKKGLIDRGIAEYKRALEINPELTQAHNNLGAVLLDLGHPEQAAAEAREALKIDPAYTDAYYNLGNALFREGNANEAIDEFRKALENDPRDAKGHYHLANTLLQVGRLDEAVEQYEKAVEIDPNFSEAYNNLGAALARKGQLDQAIAAVQGALRLRPDYRDAQINLTKMRGMAAPAPAVPEGTIPGK
jgi:tetratricopeptide (TPR) repeat protein